MYKSDVTEDSTSIAIVGLSGRFPGANSIAAFWQNLVAGKDSIEALTPQELKEVGVSDVQINDPDYVKVAARLEDVDMFAAEFFGIPPKEAQMMDPQMRLFLECAWEALEDAGCVIGKSDSRIGVFGGAGLNTYMLNYLLPAKDELLKDVGTFGMLLGNEGHYFTTQVSHRLNLCGPSISVGTACSTSLVAVHLAVNSLLNFESDVVLAGGANIELPQNKGYPYQVEGVHSPDGKCRAFDAGAQGTVPGNGVAMVALKRIQDAVEDGDHIYAVINGSAVNNDGKRKAGFSTPSVQGQREVVADALAVSGIEPNAISYIEAHGTGTRVGDPLEVKALTEAFGGFTEEKQFCALGSLKTNFGHLGPAAGVASLVKTALCLKHKKLVPSINYDAPNPDIQFSETPFFVNSELKDWQVKEGVPRRAGVSSFGIGGTNAHIVLEEWSQETEISPDTEIHQSAPEQWQIYPLSAKTPTSLAMQSQQLSHFIQDSANCPLASAAHTLQTGRTEFPVRKAVVAKDKQQLIALLEENTAVGTQSPQSKTKLAFLFPGVGEQYPQMAHDLYQNVPIFKRHLDNCFALLKQQDLDLEKVLFAPETSDVTKPTPPQQAPGEIDLKQLLNNLRQAEQGSVQQEQRGIDQTHYAHPCIFSIEYSLASTLRELGIEPDYMLGHSLGEYAVACIAGVLSLEDAIGIVCKRAKLIAELDAGAMLAVASSVEQITPFLSEAIQVGAINAHNMTVLSGTTEAVEGLSKTLTANGIAARRVNSHHAFHSNLMRPIKEQLMAAFKSVNLNPPAIQYLSNVTGDWIRAEQAQSGEYWAQHSCETVQFAAAMDKLLQVDDVTFVEVGPGQSLISFLQQHSRQKDLSDRLLPVLPSAADEMPDTQMIYQAIAQIWQKGISIDWMALSEQHEMTKLSLPGYAFERASYWVKPVSSKTQFLHQQGEQPAASSGALTAQSAAFYERVWLSERVWLPLKSAKNGSKIETSSNTWLVIQDASQSDNADSLLSSEICNGLKNLGQQLITVEKGEHFEPSDEPVNGQTSAQQFKVRLQDKASIEQLFSALLQADSLPTHILFSAQTSGASDKALVHCQMLMDFANVFASNSPNTACHFWQISRGLQQVFSHELISSECAISLGVLKAIEQEFKPFSCTTLDIEQTRAPDAAINQHAMLTDTLLPILLSKPAHLELALRHQQIWHSQFIETANTLTENNIDTAEPVKTAFLHCYQASPAVNTICDLLLQQGCQRLFLLTDMAFLSEYNWLDISEQTVDERKALSVEQQKLNCGLSALRRGGCELQIFNNNDPQMTPPQVQMLKAQTIDCAFHVLPDFSYGLMQLGGNKLLAAVEEQQQRLQQFASLLKGLNVEQSLVIGSANAEGGIAGTLAAAASINSARALSQRDLSQQVERCKTLCIDFNVEASGHLADFALPAEIRSYIELNAEHYQVSAQQAKVLLCQVLMAEQGDYIVSNQTMAKLTANSCNGGLPETAIELLKRAFNDDATQAPEGEVEEIVAEIWGAVLGVAQFSRQDHFFRIGGSSLLGVQVIARVREELELELQLKDLFANPQLHSFAALIENKLMGEIDTLSDEEVQQQLAMENTKANGMDVQGTPYTLPNGTEILQFNDVETQHFYHDIFETKVYAKNGIRLTPQATIFDVGANIGLFSLFVLQNVQNPIIYAFEPAPPVFNLLYQNTQGYDASVNLINAGVSDTCRTEELVFYPLSTGMSSFHADKQEEKDNLLAIMQNQLAEGMEGMDEVMTSAESVLEHRFQHQLYDCEMKTISSAIEQNQVQHIDLMKIDVQKCEAEVLAGIKDEHWPIIQQIVIEVHDIDDRVALVSELLRSKGFTVESEQDQLYGGSNIWNMYAIRH